MTKMKRMLPTSAPPLRFFLGGGEPKYFMAGLLFSVGELKLGTSMVSTKRIFMCGEREEGKKEMKQRL